MFLARFFEYIWNQAYDRNTQNILSMLEHNSKAVCLDIGCGDGQKTTQFKKRIGCKKMYGVDGVKARLNAARNRGIDIVFTNLEKKWPFPNNHFDVIVSNQVIEHILDIDHFILEIHRILKPGGYVVISTENLSSWHNIFALVLGFQDFSHHIIKKLHVSNPISPHFGEKTVAWSAPGNSGIDDTAFPHIKILTFKSLRKIFEVYGFNYVKGKASGYYPFFGPVGKFFSFTDPYHSHFIVIKFQKHLENPN